MSSYRVSRALPSFPTRRSSDLLTEDGEPEPLVDVVAIHRRSLEPARLHGDVAGDVGLQFVQRDRAVPIDVRLPGDERIEDRKSTRLNSSHRCISYAVFCLKKKK